MQNLPQLTPSACVVQTIPNGLTASYHLLERFDTLLLAELKQMATDFQQDKESVEQAAQILEHARNLNEKVSPAPAG